MKTTKTKLSLLTCSILLGSSLTMANAMDVNSLETYITVSDTGDDAYSTYNEGNHFFSAAEYTLLSGTNIDILFTNNYTDKKDSYFIGNTYTILSGLYTAGLTINDPSSFKITDNSVLLDFEVYADSDNLIAKAIQGETVGNTIASDNKNAGNAAVTLQNIIDNSGNYKQMEGVIGALNRLSTNKEVADAVDSTTSQTTTSSFTASNQISNNISNIVSQRQTITLNGGGLNSGDEMFGNKNVWAKAYGSIGSQDDKNGVNGFDIDSYGFGFGIDGEYSDNNQIGVGFFYTNADVDVNNVSQTSDIDVYSLIVYGANPVIDNKTHFMYQLGYSWQDTSSQRDIAFMGTSAKADYTSKVASVDLKLLRDYKINDELLLQPFVSTTYRHFNSPSYSENGAGALNLNVNSFSSSEFIVGAGTLAYYKLDDKSKLFGNANVGYDLKDDNNIVTSSYQGASGLSFETEGIDNGRVSYDLGFGYERDLSELSNLSFSYNFQGEGSEYTNHVMSAKFTLKF